MTATFYSHPVVFATSEAELVALIAVLITVAGVARLVYQQWRRHECHIKHCHRIQWKTIPGTSHIVCKHHHVDSEPSHAQVLAAHKAAQPVTAPKPVKPASKPRKSAARKPT